MYYTLYIIAALHDRKPYERHYYIHSSGETFNYWIFNK